MVGGANLKLYRPYNSNAFVELFHIRFPVLHSINSEYQAGNLCLSYLELAATALPD
jgi:hypothetical protein